MFKRKFTAIPPADPATLSKIEITIRLNDSGSTYTVNHYVGPYALNPEDAERIIEGTSRGLRDGGYEPVITRVHESRESS